MAFLVWGKQKAETDEFRAMLQLKIDPYAQFMPVYATQDKYFHKVVEEDIALGLTKEQRIQ